MAASAVQSRVESFQQNSKGREAKNIYYLALYRDSWPTLGLTTYDLGKVSSVSLLLFPSSWGRGCLGPINKEPVLDDFTS